MNEIRRAGVPPCARRSQTGVWEREKREKILGKVPDAPNQGNGDLLDQVGLGSILPASKWAITFRGTPSFPLVPRGRRLLQCRCPIQGRHQAMNAVRVETTVEADGELHLTELPCRRGDKVEAIVLILEQPSRPA
jgi:hypothetical protein